MDYKYISEHLDDVPKDAIEFVNYLERGCKAFNVSIKDNNGNFKSAGEMINDITVAGLKYYREIGEINFNKRMNN
jgi:hypothetical protein